MLKPGDSVEIGETTLHVVANPAAAATAEGGAGGGGGGGGSAVGMGAATEAAFAANPELVALADRLAADPQWRSRDAAPRKLSTQQVQAGLKRKVSSQLAPLSVLYPVP